MLGMYKIAHLLSALSCCQLFLLSSSHVPRKTHMSLLKPSSADRCCCLPSNGAQGNALPPLLSSNQESFPQIRNPAAGLQEGLPLRVFLLYTEHLRQHFKEELKGRRVNVSSSEVGLLKEERVQEVPPWVVLAWTVNKYRISTVG